MDVYILGDKKKSQLVNQDEVIINSSKYFDNENEQHLIIMSSEEFKNKGYLFNFPEKAMGETVDEKQIPNAEFYDGLIFITLNELNFSRKERRIVANEINIFLGKSNLMIIGHNENSFFKDIISKVDKTNIQKALFTVIDGILDNHKRVINTLEKEVESVEDRILKSTVLTSESLKQKRIKDEMTMVDKKGQHVLYVNEIVELRKRLKFIKKYIDTTADVVEMVEADESELIPEDFDKYYLKLSLKADRNSNSLLNLREYISQVREAWQSQIDLDLNNRMNFLTIVSVIFMPLTLIAGWYGMNFRYMPELDWKYGYLYVFLLSVIVFVISIRWLTKHKYW